MSGRRLWWSFPSLLLVIIIRHTYNKNNNIVVRLFFSVFLSLSHSSLVVDGGGVTIMLMNQGGHFKFKNHYWNTTSLFQKFWIGLICKRIVWIARILNQQKVSWKHNLTVLNFLDKPFDIIISCNHTIMKARLIFLVMCMLRGCRDFLSPIYIDIGLVLLLLFFRHSSFVSITAIIHVLMSVDI